MKRTSFLTLCTLAVFALGLAIPVTGASAHRLDRQSYGVFHAYQGACNGVYAAAYSQKRPHYYRVDIKQGRYAWRLRRIRVGTIRRRGRNIPQYQTVRKRVLVRPVRYRLHKRHAERRWVSEPVVIQGQSRYRSRTGCP